MREMTVSMSRASRVPMRLHDRAAIGLDLDQPLDGQHLEGLAQRRARDLQHLAQLLLDDAAAFRQMALDDQVAQPRRHGLVQRAPRDRPVRVGPGAKSVQLRIASP